MIFWLARPTYRPPARAWWRVPPGVYCCVPECAATTRHALGEGPAARRPPPIRAAGSRDTVSLPKHGRADLSRQLLHEEPAALKVIQIELASRPLSRPLGQSRGLAGPTFRHDNQLEVRIELDLVLLAVFAFHVVNFIAKVCLLNLSARAAEAFYGRLDLLCSRAWGPSQVRVAN